MAAVEQFSHELLPTAKHQTHWLLFGLARLGKTIEKGRGRGLDPDELRVLFGAWHRAASSRDPAFVWRPKSDYLMEFLGNYPAAKFPIDERPLIEGWKLANNEPLPPEAGQFADSSPLQKLVALCFQLAKQNGEGPGVFFLGCHDAGRLVGWSHTHAANMLNGLVRVGILELVSKGSITGLPKQGARPKGKASRYRWKGGAAK